MPHSHGLLHHLTHNFDGALEVEALARSHVQQQRDGIQLLLAMYRQIRALGQVLADQSINVSLLSRCQGLWGSQKKIVTPVLWVISACRAISRPWS